MNILENSEKHWFAFYTKPRHEFKAELEMNRLDVEVFLPKITEIKNWSDRKKRITEPLFKSYIFAECNEKERLQILQIDHIITTVNIKGKPVKIPFQQIDAVKRILESKQTIKVTKKLLKGTPVKIIEGPFAGITAIVEKQGSKTTVSVSLEILNRTVTAIIPANQLEIMKAS